MKKVLIIGATGNVGKNLVDLCLANNYQVVAYSPSALKNLEAKPNLKRVAGDIFELPLLILEAKSADVVFSCLGTHDGDLNHEVLYTGMHSIIEALQRASVKRIIAIGGAGCLTLKESQELFHNNPEFPEFLKSISHAHQRALLQLEVSKLTWTFVCPPNMYNDAGQSKDWRWQETYLLENTGKISYLNCAKAMLKAFEDSLCLEKKMALSE